LFKKSIFAAVAILSIAASATADAKPRHNQHRDVHAAIVCNQQGCSDRVSAVRHTARVSHDTVRTRVRHTHRSRAAGIRRAAVVHAPRQVRVHRERTAAIIVCDQLGCSDRVMAVQGAEARAEARHGARSVVDPNGNGAIVVGSRPAGCPHRFCGCEASRYVFGEIRPELNLAYNWIKKFPRTQPAPGMAAARSGHVMVLISHVGGNDWLVHDGNSGGGLTRDHVMSISRYVIVDPRGSRQAQR
jgi:hypothetical protein